LHQPPFSFDPRSSLRIRWIGSDRDARVEGFSDTVEETAS